MALTVREKNLVICWLAEKSTVDYMAKELGSVVKDALFKGRARYESAVFAKFNDAEIREIAEIDRKIPKD